MQLEYLPYTPLRITSPFGPRNTGIPGASTYHKGIDLGVDKSKPYTAIDGGPVTAVLPGIVISNYYNKARGWVILLDHGVIDGKNVKTLYQHLKQAGLPAERKVKGGEQIGIMGNTGVGAQLHLHFEIRLDGACVDPEPYLKMIKKLKEGEPVERRYNKIVEMPESLRKEAQMLVDAGALQGNSRGGLNITEDMLRSMIVAKRYTDIVIKTMDEKEIENKKANNFVKNGGTGI